MVAPAEFDDNIRVRRLSATAAIYRKPLTMDSAAQRAFQFFRISSFPKPARRGGLHLGTDSLQEAKAFTPWQRVRSSEGLRSRRTLDTLPL